MTFSIREERSGGGITSHAMTRAEYYAQETERDERQEIKSRAKPSQLVGRVRRVGE